MVHPMKTAFLSLIALASGLAAMGCGGSSDEKTTSFEERAKPAIAGYSTLVFESYSAALKRAEALDVALGSFVASPTSATHDAAKQAWLESRPEYLQTEAYRFYGGPIDDDDGPEGEINAWPLDEAYIDYVE